MLKFFKEYFGDYQHADVLQTVSLVLFVIFFSFLIYFVYSKPKGYYKEVSELPLEEDQQEEQQNN